MGLWHKIQRKYRPPIDSRGISQAIVDEASREELCEEVYESLRIHLNSEVDRFGVWLAPEAEYNSIADPPTFRGRFWDMDAGDSPEWNILGNLGALPEELFRQSGPIEIEVAHRRSDLLLAAAVGMRRLLWVPVRLDEQLHGVLFAATRRKQSSLPREPMIRAAAELTVAVGFQKRSISIQSALCEQAFQRKTLAQIALNVSLDRLLQEVVNSALTCNADRKPIGPFAMIGLPAGPGRVSSARDSSLEFQWTAGDRLWARSAMSGPISTIWREALVTQKTVGQEVRASWSQQQVVRVVAIPLLLGSDAAGVLVAGLQSSASRLATLERLDVRAKLASLALDSSQRSGAGQGAVASTQFFLDHSAEPWFLVNGKLEVTHASRPGSKLLSLALPRLPERSVSPNAAEQDLSLGTAAQLFRPTEWQRLVGWMREILRDGPLGESHSMDTELRTGRHVRLQAASLADGSLSLLVQRTGESLRSAESRAGSELNSLIEWLDHGVIIFGEHDEVRTANLRFSQLFGLSAAEMDSASSLRELVGLIAPRVNEPDHFAERWWDTARGPEGLHEEIQVKQPAPRVLERISRPILDSAGARIGRVEIYRDVTGEHLLQTKLRKNERLVSLGEKMSDIAHELSNPLTTILGYAQRLLARSEGSPRRDDIQRIFSEAERASSILRQLLGSTHESAPDLRPIQLNSLIQRTVDVHRFQLASEGIRVDLDLATSLPQMLGDAGQLQQILVNLTANARHALLEMQRPGSISFRTRMESGQIFLEVSDSGPGIPEALRHRVFDPFFTTKPAGVGTGLGLSIVAGLVRQHGGHIHLNPAARQGASFLLDFPSAAAEAPLLLSELPPALSVAPPVPRGERVLVVEDEPTVAQLISDVLSDLGYVCEIQHDARRALISALNRDYDLVVCDIKMPGLDGPHFYRALAEAGSSLSSRFLFVTGDVLGASTQDFLRENRLPNIAKPFRVEEFTEKIALMRAEPAAPAGVSVRGPGFRHKNLVGHG